MGEVGGIRIPIINYCIFQMNNWKPTFAPACLLSYEKSHMEGNNKALFPEQS